MSSTRARAFRSSTVPELTALLEGADLYMVNDYEWTSTLQRTGLSEAQVIERVGRVVITRGEQGSIIREGDRTVEVAPVPAAEIVDPTGCGDAYRAGLLHGLRRGLPIERAARIGSVMGSLLVERAGTQSLDLNRDELESRIEAALGSDA